MSAASPATVLIAMRFVFMAATLASERLTPEVSENNLIWSDVRYWWSVKAEFVAFGVGHDDEPVFQGRVRVDSAKPGSSEFRQSAAFGFERVHPFIAVESGRSPNVEVQAVLHRFGLRYGLEEDAGADLIWSSIAARMFSGPSSIPRSAMNLFQAVIGSSPSPSRTPGGPGMV